MKFWWVNHKKTFRQEFNGKYIWSPKRKSNGHLNPFYETMREVRGGDIIFSFAGAAIRGFGIARTHCYSSPRPDEFGRIGDIWDEIGWRVDVDFQKFIDPVRPTLHMDILRPVLPPKYSPIKEQGYGNQNAYLSPVPQAMALVVAQLTSPELLGIIQGVQFSENADTSLPELKGIIEWEDRECTRISKNSKLPETEKDALIKSRRGQGLFRQKVGHLERFCRVTRVDRPEHLIASHIKPWRECDNLSACLRGMASC